MNGDENLTEINETKNMINYIIEQAEYKRKGLYLKGKQPRI